MHGGTVAGRQRAAAQGFAGDTFNAAWYARACLPQDWSVDYFTALGDDPLSEDMLAFIAEAGIGTEKSAVSRGTPGLYLINLKDGERTFSYWRNAAAARQLAADADHLRKTVESADVVYFSGITLAILASAHDVDTFLAELRRARAAGKLVVFDPNIRPRLWADRDVMLETISMVPAPQRWSCQASMTKPAISAMSPWKRPSPATVRSALKTSS